MPNREKRTKPIKAHITPALFEQLELFKAEEGGSTVISMSDYLFGVLESHVAYKSAMRSSKQRLTRRA